MKRKEEWARPEWRQRVTKVVEQASDERDSSEALIASAEREFGKLREMLARAQAKAGVAPLSAAGRPPMA